MKKKITSIIYLLLATAALTPGCKKTDLPQPEMPTTSTEVRFSLAALPGTPNGSTNISAIVTVVDQNNQEVCSNKKLNLIYDDRYLTEKLELPKGNYKLTKFIVMSSAGIVRYATPLVSSPKASLVQKPLVIPFVTPNSEPLTVPVEVLNVGTGETPESFGYPAGSFTFPSTEPGNFSLQLRAFITVGNIVYDSIQADFTIMLWDENGVLHQRDTLLAAGPHQIEVPKAYTKYGFIMRKWGLTADLILQKSEVNESTVYVISGHKTAKKLKEATEYRFLNGAFELDQKKLFEYDNEGRIKEVKYYTRSPYETQLKHTGTEQYRYTGNKLEIYYVDVQNGISEPYLSATHDYDGAGKRIRSEQHQITNRAIYEYVYTGQGITMYYLNSDGSRTGTETQLKFTGGNCVEQKSMTPVSASRNRYLYDFNINPYVHMRLPDLSYEHDSKNNVLKVLEINTDGSEQESSRQQNSYDSDGFLTEVNRGWSKTVFTY